MVGDVGVEPTKASQSLRTFQLSNIARLFLSCLLLPCCPLVNISPRGVEIIYKNLSILRRPDAKPVR